MQWHRHRSAMLTWQINLDHQMEGLIQSLCMIDTWDTRVTPLCNPPVWTGAKIRFLIGELKIDAHNELSKLSWWRKLTINSIQIWSKQRNHIFFPFSHAFVSPKHVSIDEHYSVPWLTNGVPQFTVPTGTQRAACCSLISCPHPFPCSKMERRTGGRKYIMGCDKNNLLKGGMK